MAASWPFSSFWAPVLPVHCPRFDPMALLPAHVRPQYERLAKIWAGAEWTVTGICSTPAYSGKAFAVLSHFLCHFPSHKLERNALLLEHVKISHLASGNTSGLLLQSRLHVSLSSPHHGTEAFLKLHAAWEEQKSIHSSVFNGPAFRMLYCR